MKRVLYVEKCTDYSGGDDRNRIDAFLNRTKSAIFKELYQDYVVDLGYNFGSWVPLTLNENFNGLLTHFPMDYSVLHSDEANSLTGEKFYRLAYGPSADTMKEIREKFPSLPIVVYTGASTGGIDDPSMSPMHKIITESGANRVVFRSSNLVEDAKAIHKHFKELISN